jgi:hypothetical protein
MPHTNSKTFSGDSNSEIFSAVPILANIPK